jgi:hypothetical protein
MVRLTRKRTKKLCHSVDQCLNYVSYVVKKCFLRPYVEFRVGEEKAKESTLHKSKLSLATLLPFILQYNTKDTNEQNPCYVFWLFWCYNQWHASASHSVCLYFCLTCLQFLLCGKFIKRETRFLCALCGVHLCPEGCYK